MESNQPRPAGYQPNNGDPLANAARDYSSQARLRFEGHGFSVVCPTLPGTWLVDMSNHWTTGAFALPILARLGAKWRARTAKVDQVKASLTP
jgi:hypothetical protein